MTRERVQSTSTHTHFFRDAPQLASIAAVIARTAERGARRPLVWSAGCSTGAEPYTLAMMCAEQGVEPVLRATDFNPGALAVARAGRYATIALRQTPEAYVARYFTREPDAFIGYLALGFTMGQWLCLAMIAGGLALFAWSRRQPS